MTASFRSRAEEHDTCEKPIFSGTLHLLARSVVTLNSFLTASEFSSRPRAPYSSTSSVMKDILPMPFLRLNSISFVMMSSGKDLKLHMVGLQKWHLLGHPRVIWTSPFLDGVIIGGILSSGAGSPLTYLGTSSPPSSFLTSMGNVSSASPSNSTSMPYLSSRPLSCQLPGPPTTTLNPYLSLSDLTARISFSNSSSVQLLPPPLTAFRVHVTGARPIGSSTCIATSSVSSSTASGSMRGGTITTSRLLKPAAISEASTLQRA